jgi:uncharacterized protein (DUF885 family)
MLLQLDWRIATALVAGGLAALAPAASARQPPPDAALHALLERAFQQRMAEHPEEATALGVAGYDDRLTDPSAAAVARRRLQAQALARDLKRFDPGKLSTQDRISRAIVLERAELASQEGAFYGDLPFGADGDTWLAISPMQGPQYDFTAMAQAMRFAGTRDYENYLKRLSAMPAYLEAIVARLRVGMRTGWLPGREAMLHVPEIYDAFSAADVTGSPLWRPFASFPPDMPPADRERITLQARQVLSLKVHPAFANLKQFLQAEYLPACREPLGASTLPGGPAFYALMIREHTTLALDPAQIHETGLREVARIGGEMDEAVASAGFKGSRADFALFVRTDARFRFSKPEQRLAAYRDIAKRADAELPRFFATLPRTPYGIRPMEAFEGDNGEHYTPSPLDGSRAGFFEANVNNIEKRSSYFMEAVLLHETVPGHHLQGAIAHEIEAMPSLRRAIEHNAYVEGWALYAESLGRDMGFYRDPYSRFGALTLEMLRASRLVVDTGIHAMGWSRERSIRYVVEQSGLDPDFAAAEVDRYIVWPGQALSYKVGDLEIRALRAKAKAALGESFDLRRFHDAVLADGSLPLTILRTRIDDWIASERRAAKLRGT